jgi:hypothetical protein
MLVIRTLQSESLSLFNYTILSTIELKTSLETHEVIYGTQDPRFTFLLILLAATGTQPCQSFDPNEGCTVHESDYAV